MASDEGVVQLIRKNESRGGPCNENRKQPKLATGTTETGGNQQKRKNESKDCHCNEKRLKLWTGDYVPGDYHPPIQETAESDTTAGETQCLPPANIQAVREEREVSESGNRMRRNQIQRQSLDERRRP